MKKNILVVDDSPSIRQMVAFTLKASGFEVFSAESGNEAINIMNTSGVLFSLFITDQNMPGMSGIDLVRAIREVGHYAKTPIMFLTTESNAEMKAAGKAAGATGWMLKPFDPATLAGLAKKLVPD